MRVLFILSDNIYLTPYFNFYKELLKKLSIDYDVIYWDKNINELDSFIRGLSPYPTAWANLSHNKENLAVKIFSVTPLIENHSYKIGQIIIENKAIKVAVRDGFIQINELQLPSKKRMSSKELLNGFSFNSDDYFF